MELMLAAHSSFPTRLSGLGGNTAATPPWTPASTPIVLSCGPTKPRQGLSEIARGGTLRTAAVARAWSRAVSASAAFCSRAMFAARPTVYRMNAPIAANHSLRSALMHQRCQHSFPPALLSLPPSTPPRLPLSAPLQRSFLSSPPSLCPLCPSCPLHPAPRLLLCPSLLAPLRRGPRDGQQGRPATMKGRPARTSDAQNTLSTRLSASIAMISNGSASDGPNSTTALRSNVCCEGQNIKKTINVVEQ